MYLGIDIGTSSVKSLLVDESQAAVAEASRALTVRRPAEGWSEQEPGDWWRAVVDTVDEIHESNRRALATVRGIGLSGQMHGATLLDGQGRVLRPCILWNDGRSGFECAEFERRCPDSRRISGNIAMPGFTAPKLLWVRHHEPEVFEQLRKVLLPKDYVRYCLCGDYVGDLSDCAGTLWLDTAGRRWSEELLAACDLDESFMPSLVEGSEAGGELSAPLARRWGMAVPPVIAGGAGDNAASACGIGAVRPGDAFISLGTSGVLFVVNDRFSPNADNAVHAFCHAVPQTWHQMGVILSAASCFDWLAGITGCSVGDIYHDLEQPAGDDRSLFLPYLGGERTPHNSASARGLFHGLGHDTSRADLARAIARGVGYAFRDCLAALTDAGSRVDSLAAVGGGAGSNAWLETLADILGLPITRASGAGTGAAFGAARLAMAAVNGQSIAGIMTPPAVEIGFEPRSGEHQRHQENWSRYRELYPAA